MTAAATFPAYANSPSSDQDEAWIAVPDPRTEREKFGYINRKGCWVTDPIFDEAYPFSEGLAKVAIDGKYGFVDRRGRIAVPARYRRALSFSDGMAAVSSGPDRPAEGGFIDKNGEIAITRDRLIEILAERMLDPKHFYFRDGLLALNGKNANCLAITKEGKVAFRLADASFITHGFDDPSIPGEMERTRETSEFMGFSEGLAAIRLEGKNDTSRHRDTPKTAYVTKDGKRAFPSRFTSSGYFSEGLAPVIIDDERRSVIPVHNFIDARGEVALSSRFYLGADSFNEGLAPVVLGNRTMGFIDKTGRVKFEVAAEAALRFSGGLAAILRDKRWGFVDRNGTVVIEPKYDEVFQLGPNSRNFLPADKTIWTALGDRTTLIDATGAEIYSFTMSDGSRPTVTLSPTSRCR